MFRIKRVYNRSAYIELTIREICPLISRASRNADAAFFFLPANAGEETHDRGESDFFHILHHAETAPVFYLCLLRLARLAGSAYTLCAFHR